MKNEKFITIQQFCRYYNIPENFIETLHEYELIEIIDSEDAPYVSTSQIKVIEKMIRLHYELDINLEGLDAICTLLKQVESLNQEIINLNNRLRFYEDLD